MFSASCALLCQGIENKVVVEAKKEGRCDRCRTAAESDHEEKLRRKRCICAEIVEGPVKPNGSQTPSPRIRGVAASSYQLIAHIQINFN
ncbi:MAG: hypothetical protein WBF35_09220, partial [Candidatus Acidiferrales bacterium]